MKSAPQTCILKGVFHDASVKKATQLQQLKAYTVTYKNFFH